MQSRHSDPSSISVCCLRFTTSCADAPFLSRKDCCQWDFGLALVVEKTSALPGFVQMSSVLSLILTSEMIVAYDSDSRVSTLLFKGFRE